MEYRKLGRTGIKVSELCLGTMQFGWTAGQQESYEVLDASLDAGINFLDTADVYSRWAAGNPGGVAETIIGDWMKKSNVPRDKIVIATKVRARVGEGPNDEGLSRAHILQAVEASLLRLKTDYIDLYQAHAFDETTPIEETLRAFDDLVRQGKVRYIGCSNYPAWKLVQALWVADKYILERYETLQPHYSLVNRSEFERELAQVCSYYGIGVLPYSPLGGGFLTGKYRRDSDLPDSQRKLGVQRHFKDRNWALLNEMEAVAQEKGDYTISQIALAWLLSNPLVTSPIIGARSIEQLKDNLGAVGLRLSTEEKARLDAASEWQER
jgi:aryl-alcohol dehydrogenase-like predicted oxidoreductase